MMTTPVLPHVDTLSPFEALADYRRAVAEVYARLRQPGLSPAEKHLEFRQARDRLFGAHPQSALSRAQKANFTSLDYYPYNPNWRFILPVDSNVEPEIIEIELQHDGITRLQRFGRVHFEIEGQSVSLSLYWILGYGGGIFLPFRDATSGQTTYGGGRYLLDTIKHADLGYEGNKIVLDFNFAYNPSCAYNARWVCPLAPRENWLPVRVPAGERQYAG